MDGRARSAGRGGRAARRRRSLVTIVACVLVLAVLVFGIKTAVDTVQSILQNTLGATVSTEEEVATIVEEEAEEEELLVWTDEAYALQDELDAAVAAIEEAGYEVGYIVIDIATGETLEYNADTVFYGASSIKGPYVVSLVQALGSEAVDAYTSTIESCLLYSSNTSYTTLRSAYASCTFFDELVEEVGASLEFVGNYAFFSPRSLALLWAGLADYLTSDAEDAQWLGTLLADSLYSTVDDAAAEGDVTFSKAGWYWGGAEEYDTTADGGLVVFGSGTFAVAVMTTKAADFEAVSSVMDPLVALWEELYNEEYSSE